MIGRRSASPGRLPAQLIATYKPELIEILRGDRCRWCGELLAWPRPVGVVFGDNTAECHRCADAECERIWRAAKRVTISPDALADPAEAILKDMIK